MLTPFEQAVCGGHEAAYAARTESRGARKQLWSTRLSYGTARPLTLEDLPASSTTFWVSRRKAEVLAAIDGRLIAIDDACARYRLSLEEIAAWRRSVERAGIPGLRTTRLQHYRDHFIE